MASKGVQDRVELAAPTIWAAFAYADFIVEAVRRQLPHSEATFHEQRLEQREGEPRYITLAQFLRGHSFRLGRIRDRMVAADLALDRERRSLSEEIRRRDELVKKVYGRVVGLRDRFEDHVGRRRTTTRLLIEGETPRQPKELMLAARSAAGVVLDRDVWLPEPPVGEVVVRRMVGQDLLDDCDALGASLEAIHFKESGEQGAISVREQTIAVFDEARANLGRFVERALEFHGMPTLAATVRPELAGTGRPGRPSKKRPRDLFPDLVEAALALDPGAGLTFEEISARVPRRPVEYQRMADVPSPAEVTAALEREAGEFYASDPGGRPEELRVADAEEPELLQAEDLGGPGAVARLKDWIAAIGRTVAGRKE